MCDSVQTEYEDRMRGDPRSIEELISVALSELDEDLAWEPVCVLHFRGTREVLDRANELCRSRQIAERCLGANVLGQLGIPERTFPTECLAILLQVLSIEANPEVIRPILIALGHLALPEAIEPASRLRTHPDPEVRNGVACCLMGYDDQRAVDSLIELSKDEDAYVRDWATFGLGTQIDLDTKEIRDALAERLNDADDYTRIEAITGLAKRKDQRVLPAISKELASDRVENYVLEAATVLADPRLYPLLVAIKDRCVGNKKRLLEAITACAPDI